MMRHLHINNKSSCGHRLQKCQTAGLSGTAATQRVAPWPRLGPSLPSSTTTTAATIRNSGSIPFTPSSRKLQALQAEEHTFFWGQPNTPRRDALPKGAPRAAPGPHTTTTTTTATVSNSTASITTDALTAAEHEASRPSSGHVTWHVADVDVRWYHSLAAAETLGDMVWTLQDLVETIQQQGSSSSSSCGRLGAGSPAGQMEAADGSAPCGLATAAVAAAATAQDAAGAGSTAGARAGGGGAAAAAAASVAVLPPRLVEVSLAKAAAWVLDPGSSAGISNQLVAQLLLVLQPSLTHSGFSGYNLDDVRSVLRSLGIILGACGWGPEVQEGEEAQGNWGTHGDASGSSNDDSGDSIRSCGDDVRVSCRWEGRQDVVAAVAAWLCGEEGAAAVDWCESFPQLVSFLWGYAALAGGGGGAAAVVHVPEPTAGGAAAGQGASTEGASAGAGTGGDGDGAAARWAVGGHEVGAAFEKLVQRTASALILPYRRQASAAELADAVWALSVVGRRSGAVAMLAEVLAMEVKSHVCNAFFGKHAAFAPGDLVKVVQAYARMQLVDGSVPHVLNAIGGDVAQRIRSRHAGAVTRPADCAQLIQSFADCGHNSVVIPELLSAVGLQICREVAAHNEQLASACVQQEPRSYITSNSSSSSNSNNNNSNSNNSYSKANTDTQIDDAAARLRAAHAFSSASPAAAAHHWSHLLQLQQAVSVLRTHVRLGYAPPPQLLTSLLLVLLPQLIHAPQPPQHVAELLLLLARVRYMPGQETLDALARAALGAAGADSAAGAVGPDPAAASFPGAPTAAGTGAAAVSAPVSRLQSLWALSMMGWSPDEDTLDQVLSPVLLDDSAPPLSPLDAARLMAALCLAPREQLTIQRFGLACVRLREALATSSSSRGRARVQGRGGARDKQIATQQQQQEEGHVLLAAGAAMVVLGLEGWEMAEQVLPGAVFRRVEAAARGLLQRPYAGVDDSCLAGAVQALLAAGCTAVRPMGQVPVVDVLHPCNGGESSRSGSSGSSGGNGSGSSSTVTASANHGVDVGAQGAVGEQVVAAVGEQQQREQEEDPGGDGYDHDECYYEPLQSNVLVVQLPLPGADLCGRGEALGHRQHPFHQRQQQQQVEVVVDVCLPHDYGLGSKAPWGWARLRHAVYRSCRTAAAAGGGRTAGTAGGEVLVLDERTLYSLQGSKERMEEYVRQLLRERQRT